MPQVIDKTKNKLITKLYNIDNFEKQKMFIALLSYGLSIGKATWFWQKIKDHNAMQLLDIVDSSQKIDSVCLALLNSFKSPCTVNTLYKILQAIFGQTSTLQIIEKQGSIDVDIKINTAENSFYYQWISKNGDTVITKSGKSLVFKRTNKLGFYGDIKSFLKLFVQDGVEIGTVNIGQSDELLKEQLLKKGVPNGKPRNH